jgi:hypothetical protein
VLDARAAAVSAADGTCPRCGARREPPDRYCLDCGLALPEVTGTVASLRRRWLRRLGWYPGDWVWPALLSLPVAVAGAAVAIAVTTDRDHARASVLTATASADLTRPAPVTTAPEPGAQASRRRIGWPRGVDGWTLVLVSYPEGSGHQRALTAVSKALDAKLRQVGILDSDRWPSLQPGYEVVFTGVYDSEAAASAALPAAQDAGFGAAYVRWIAR